jgi:hypothetical protein
LAKNWPKNFNFWPKSLKKKLKTPKIKHQET